MQKNTKPFWMTLVFIAGGLYVGFAFYFSPGSRSISVDNTKSFALSTQQSVQKKVAPYVLPKNSAGGQNGITQNTQTIQQAPLPVSTRTTRTS